MPGTIHSIPLLSITLSEFRAAHDRVSAASEEEAGRVAREFRTTQAGLYKYVPYTASTQREVAHENSRICAWARRVCAVLEDRHGHAPILNESEIHRSEVLAKKMLADPETLNRIRNMDLIRAAEIGILGPETVEGTIIIPDANRVLLKVVTLAIAFTGAVKYRT